MLLYFIIIVNLIDSMEIRRWWWKITSRNHVESELLFFFFSYGKNYRSGHWHAHYGSGIYASWRT